MGSFRSPRRRPRAGRPPPERGVGGRLVPRLARQPATSVVDSPVTEMPPARSARPLHLPFLSSDSSPPSGERPSQSGKRVVRNGAPTNDLVLSAYTASNEQVFPRVLGLYVAPGSVVADVTHGKGVFWRQVEPDRYRVLASDLADGVDCRALPYEDGSVDCVVLDPPYMHSPGGTTHSGQNPFESYYRNNGTGNRTSSKYHEAVLELYVDAGKEARRVLRDLGVFIVKCQDEVCSNRQRFTHVELMREYEEMGFVAEDLFVVVRNNRPGVSRTKRQVHARKNHSYCLVFWKRGAGGAIWEPPD